MSILFQNEWTREDGSLVAIPHVTTKNESFLRHCQVLKRMGVKNYAFPLTLYNPELKHVDVHALEEDTPENIRLRMAVMTEARFNVWYFMRECVRVVGQGGDPVKFRLDRNSCAMIWSFLCGIDYVGMAPRQFGKEQPLSALIRTPSGWTTMGDIKLHDKVVTPDGGTANVVGVYPQGIKDKYRVTFEDGRSTECGLEHLWKVYNRDWSPKTNRWRVLSLGEIMEWMDNHPNSEVGFHVPLIEPEEKPDVDLPIDPYVLGILIGDGGLTTGSVKVSTPDAFVIDELRRLIPENIDVRHIDKFDYVLVDKNVVPGKKSSLITTLRDLDLMGCYSHQKFIPAQYMNASPRQKWDLLQGLMDSDGTVGKNRSVSFTTTSVALAHQFEHLVRSLGGVCRTYRRVTKYTHNGEQREGRLSYTMQIRFRDTTKALRLPRKRDRLFTGAPVKDTSKLRIVSIEYAGREEAQCIEIDHPDHLYITDDYIVTHNTICAVCLVAWIMYIAGQQFQIGHFCKDNQLREENVKRVRGIAENLPPWWLDENKFRDKKNTSELYYHALGTHFQTGVAQADDRKADLQARGSSQPVQWFDEFEFIVNIGRSYPTMIASTTAARENARLNGKPYSNIITTTAGDPSNPACQEAAEIIDGAMPFSEFLHDCENLEQLHAMVEAASPQKMIIGVFSHFQLGKDNDWLRGIIRRTNATKEQIMRDYLNRRVSISAQPVIPKHILAMITASQTDTKHLQIVNGRFMIRWYLDKEVVQSESFKHRPIIVGCDSSEMIGRDATTLVGIDPRDFSVVFTFRANEGNLNTVGAVIAELLIEYPGFVFVPENKSSGTGFIDNVSLLLRKHGHNPFKRIFNWVVHNRREVEFAKYDIRDTSLLDTSVKKYFGIKTDKSKRDELYSSTLLTACERGATKIRDQTLIAELSGLVEKNGRVDHEVGCHDDTCIAFLMAAWLILNGKNLDVYGIAPGTILSMVPRGKSEDAQIEMLKQEKIQARIDELLEIRKRQPDIGIRALLDRDLEMLQRLQTRSATAEAVTADDLHRNPRKFVDQEIASANRKPASQEDVVNSVKSLLRAVA